MKIGDIYLVEIPTVGGHEQEWFETCVKEIMELNTK